MDKIGIYVEIGPNLAKTITEAIDMRGSADSASSVINAFDLKEIIEVAVRRETGPRENLGSDES